MVNRFDVYLINLDDEVSDDPKNTRPAVVISPDEANRHLNHVVIAPLSATNSRYPTRLPITFLNAERFVIIDQIRTVENGRLVKRIGSVDDESASAIASLLLENFAA